MAKYSNGLEDKLDLTESGIKVLEGRYLKKGSDGKVTETAQDMFKRVAYNIAEAEKNYPKGPGVEQTAEKFYDMMCNLYFLPNSPTLMNAGRDLQQLSGCFVIPIEDSIESIFESAKQGAIVHKSGGGTGYSFSRLRPKNDLVRSTSGISSGPVSFMYAHNTYTDVVKQGGTRRGANMGILRVNHPDILEFIGCKSVPNEKNKMIASFFSDSKYLQRVVERFLIENYQLNNFNISVAITDKFMEAVEKNQDYELIHPKSREVVQKLNAREVFNNIAENAWRSGEPGIIFIDKINRYNPTPEIGEIESTNPCGEQPLLPYESCNLGSIDLSKFVEKGKVNYSRLEEIVKRAVHFLDNVIDMNNYPLPQIEKVTKANRKIGLGVMGFADLLIELGIPYGSHESISKAEKIMSFVQEKSKEASQELAEKRGSFPNIEKSIYKGKKMRNASTTTIAPTGTIGVITGCSQGIEPLYALVYKRKTPQFELLESNKIFKRIAEEKGFYSEELIKEIYEKNGSIKQFENIPNEIKELFVTTLDLTPEEHIRIQATFQKYTDNAVSKTINFPEFATKEEVLKAYMLSYKLGCKGLTIYRDKSRDVQVLNTGNVEITPKSLQSILAEESLNASRPERVIGETLSAKTSFGKLYLTVNNNKQGGKLYEAFPTIGKTGGDIAAMGEGYGRLLSMLFKVGVPAESIIEQLEGIGGKEIAYDHGKIVTSLPDAIAKLLKKRLENIASDNGEEVNKTATKQSKSSGNLCPKCGSGLLKQEGCEKCSNLECDYTRCG